MSGYGETCRRFVSGAGWISPYEGRCQPVFFQSVQPDVLK
ncbi:hypothetical protein SAMN06272735_3489 [Streptomyces sp. TLI_55]|nr:hypothetical protein SAMN06272735_3489 [Streptomyces sp. TLI_55]